MNIKQRNKTFFIAFAAIWIGLILWNIFTPATEFSESENRYLKTFPTFSIRRLLDGDFMDDVNIYLNDQFAGRPIWVSGQSLLEFALGKREINTVFIGHDALLGDNPLPDSDVTQKNIEGINAFAERYKIPTYFLLAPTATQIQDDKLPLFASGWDELEYISIVNGSLHENITPVAIAEILHENQNEYIYFHTDHHWTADGAYLAYQKLAAAMGLAEHQKSEFHQEILSENFYGSLHSKTGFPLVTPDTIRKYTLGKALAYTVFDGTNTTEYPGIYFDEFLDKKDQYSYFLGQVQPHVTIKTDAAVNRKLIVFKDSYAHILIPMILSDFREITLVDLRFINSQDFEDVLAITNYDEALFLYNTSVFSQQIGAAKFMQQTE